jgi:hypothetical protein
MNLSYCEIINIPKVEDSRGNLSFFESKNHLPFDIKRVYWIYDVPGGYERGGHAFKTQHEFIIALSGSFDVSIDDGHVKQIFSLNRSYYGLYIPAGYWRFMTNFSTNALALVASSTQYSEGDYIRNYEEFIQIAST